MSRRALGVTALLCLAVLSGCSLPADGPETTVTAAPVPGDDRAGAGGGADLPGIYRGAVTDAAALAREHREALENRTYRVRQRSVSVVVGQNIEDTRTVYTTTTYYRHGEAVRQDRAIVRRQLDSGNTSRTNVSTYTVDGERFVRRSLDGNASFRVVDPEPRPIDNTSRFVAELLALDETEVDSVVWNGQSRYLVTGRDSADGSFARTRNYTARAIIQEDGVVRRLNVSYVRASIGSKQTRTFRMVVDPIPPSAIRPPEWLDAARENTTD